MIHLSAHIYFIGSGNAVFDTQARNAHIGDIFISKKPQKSWQKTVNSNFRDSYLIIRLEFKIQNSQFTIFTMEYQNASLFMAGPHRNNRTNSTRLKYSYVSRIIMIICNNSLWILFTVWKNGNLFTFSFKLRMAPKYSNVCCNLRTLSPRGVVNFVSPL